MRRYMFVRSFAFKLLYICAYSILILVLCLFKFYIYFNRKQLPYTKVRIICIY